MSAAFGFDDETTTISWPSYSGTMSKLGDDIIGSWKHRVFNLNSGFLSYSRDGDMTEVCSKMCAAA